MFKYNKITTKFGEDAIVFHGYEYYLKTTNKSSKYLTCAVPKCSASLTITTKDSGELGEISKINGKPPLENVE